MELKLFIRIYEAQKMMAVSSSISELLSKRASIGGAIVGISQKGCLIISQPSFRKPLSPGSGEMGFVLKIVCKEIEDSFDFLSQLSEKLSHHEATIELL
ncbi:MAG: hypothetical protein QW039_06895 [Fervidicoccaceae archaeon]